MSRDKILAAVRDALRAPVAPPHEDPGPPQPPAPPDDLRGPVERFRDAFEAAGGIWIESPDPEAAIRSIVPQGKIWRGGPLEDPDSYAAAVTGCDAAIAETGSFGLLARPGQGRLPSLVAPVHIVLVRRDQIVPTLDDWLAWLAPRLRAAAVLITGPSRSADIEQILTIGVHGPAEVYAVLYA